MSPEGIVTSGADLLSSAPADLFSSAVPDSPDMGDVSTDDTDAPLELESPEELAEEVPEEPEAEQPEEEVRAEEPAAPADELPEGVRRGKDRNGKEGLWVTPQRWDSIYGHHQMMQQTANNWGEPVTPEGLDVRNRAFIGQEKLYGDLLSGDPAAQASVLNHFLQEGARAVQDGEIGTDPIIPLAQQFYGTLRDSHPDAYATLRMQAAKDLVQELYQEAGVTGKRDLWVSLAHVADALKLPYRKTDEFATFSQQQADPMTALQKRNQELENQLQGRQVNNQAAQFDTWRNGTKQAVRTALLDEAVVPALAETQKAWEKFPDAFKSMVVDPLHSAVKATIEADTKFSQRIADLNKSAQRATSAQRRGEIGEQIRQAYINRAKLAIEAHAPKIKQDAARIFKERSDANHARRNAAPQRGPKGNGSPAPQRIPDSVGRTEGGMFSVDRAMSDMKRLGL